MLSCTRTLSRRSTTRSRYSVRTLTCSTGISSILLQEAKSRTIKNKMILSIIIMLLYITLLAICTRRNRERAVEGFENDALKLGGVGFVHHVDVDSVEKFTYGHRNGGVALSACGDGIG